MNLVWNVLGVQQVSTNGFELVSEIMLSIYVMFPAIKEIGLCARTNKTWVRLNCTNKGVCSNFTGTNQGFFKEHTSNVNKSFFVKAAGKLWPAADAAALSEYSFDGPDSSIHSNRIYRGFSNRVFAVFAIIAIGLILGMMMV